MTLVPPKQLQLLAAVFPKEKWAEDLVKGLNQFALETTKALTVAAPVYKVLTFTTGVTVANSFPIDFPVEDIVNECRVAMVLKGVPSGAVSVVAQMLSGGKKLRVSTITGLAASTAYSIRLALA